MSCAEASRLARASGVEEWVRAVAGSRASRSMWRAASLRCQSRKGSPTSAVPGVALRVRIAAADGLRPSAAFRGRSPLVCRRPSHDPERRGAYKNGVKQRELRCSCRSTKQQTLDANSATIGQKTASITSSAKK